MTTEAKNLKPVVTFVNPYRAVYSNIVIPREFVKGDGKPRHDASFLVDPNSEELKKLQAEVVKLMKSAHPGKQIVARRLTQEEVDKGNVIQVQTPWYKGEQEAERIVAKAKPGNEAKAAARAEIFKGKIILKASSKYIPDLAAVENGKLLQFDKSDDASVAVAAKFFWPGRYVVPSFKLNIYPGDAKKLPGVSLYLDSALAMFVKKPDGTLDFGEKILGAGGRNAAEVFKGVLGSISQEDPTGGAVDELDDEILF